MDRLGWTRRIDPHAVYAVFAREHMHFLREVKQTDVVEVSVRILGTDRKRIHAAFDMSIGRYPDRLPPRN